MTHISTRTTDFALTISTRSTVPTVTAWAVAFGHTVLVWNDRVKTRKHLKNIPQSRLSDIGLTPYQAQAEIMKWFFEK